MAVTSHDQARQAEKQPGVAQTNATRLLWLRVAIGVLVVVLLASIAIGSKDIPIRTVLDALLAYDDSDDHAIIQALTRNPLADPGILGVNAGAAFFVLLAVGVFGITAIQGYIWFAFLGAIVTTVVVYMVGSAGKAGATPVRLTLAGVAVGAVLDGAAISSYPAKEVARRLGLLPQSSIAPEGITVADLIARGRYPHQKLLKRWSREDEAAVIAAMAATKVTGLSHRLVDELSGGQRQRAWVAMVLAQETPLLLHDEPTTFLDITHQIELLDLLADLNRRNDQTVVAVLHDLNHACRYASHIIAMRDGAVIAEGAPRDIVTAELVEAVFGLPCIIIDDPIAHTPLVIPRGSIHTP